MKYQKYLTNPKEDRKGETEDQKKDGTKEENKWQNGKPNPTIERKLH